MTDDEIIEALSERFAKAEQKMLDEFQKDLFSEVSIGNSSLEATPWKWHEELIFNIRHSKLVRRVHALWNVLWTGTCGYCEVYEDD